MTDILPKTLARLAAEEHAAARADAAERVKIQWSIADAGMKALLLVNGGAIIALFTFLGNVLSREPGRMAISADRLWLAFGFFIAGLVLALLTHLAGFVSQERFYMQSIEEAWRTQNAAAAQAATERGERETLLNWQGATALYVAMGSAASSLVAFTIGSVSVLWGLR